MTEEKTREFFDKLQGPDGCDFQEDGTWKCNGDRAFSQDILQKMNVPNKEANNFLKECEALGGHCDCEIIFNAAERLKDQGK